MLFLIFLLLIVLMVASTFVVHLIGMFFGEGVFLAAFSATMATFVWLVIVGVLPSLHPITVAIGWSALLYYFWNEGAVEAE